MQNVAIFAGVLFVFLLIAVGLCVWKEKERQEKMRQARLRKRIAQEAAATGGAQSDGFMLTGYRRGDVQAKAMDCCKSDSIFAERS